MLYTVYQSLKTSLAGFILAFLLLSALIISAFGSDFSGNIGVSCLTGAIVVRKIETGISSPQALCDCRNWSTEYGK